ncbi:hypothetical protein Sango_3091800 [Sesamum angolense]|uniref:DUF4283 domain-containing protein n=1 Tax=Sesamum angolense TaxID=2727404 RepID=A0AAE1W168_9LAMI|nr:hypothetical protein Sango_3091800 [Sesamum angolense]
MEEVIEGGLWLYLGQPIVLQKWEPGMVLRKLKHTEVPIWIKLRHLPVELWTTEGLSTVASGIGRPLCPDAITRACTRLDFARVCVMLNVSSKLPKHVVIMMPNELGGESACKADVDYEWLPPKCTGCSSLGHSTKECPLSKPTKPAVSIFVKKSMPITQATPELKLREQVKAVPVPEETHPETEVDRVSKEMSGHGRDKVYGANDVRARRELWQGLIDLAVTVGNKPWLVGGDFNAVLDLSEVSGASGDIRVAMNEFNNCIIQTGLLSLPMQGERFTWHNCSLDDRSLWKRLDRLLVSLFCFDNYLALSPGFLASVHSIWRHPVVGTPMYSVTRKLKALKPVFRQ